MDFSTREFVEEGFFFGDVGNGLSWKCLCGVGNCWEVVGGGGKGLSVFSGWCRILLFLLLLLRRL